MTKKVALFVENGAKTSLKDDGVLVFLSATPSEIVKSSVYEVIKIPTKDPLLSINTSTIFPSLPTTKVWWNSSVEA